LYGGMPFDNFDDYYLCEINMALTICILYCCNITEFYMTLTKSQEKEVGVTLICNVLNIDVSNFHVSIVYS